MNIRFRSALSCVLLLVSVCAALPSSAEKQEYVSINDIREEVKDGWHQTYEAHGRTITVDAPIIVPPVDAIPIVRIGFPPVLTPHDNLATYTYAEKTGIIYSVESKPGVFEGDGDCYEIAGPDAQAEDNPLTMKEAQDLCKQLIMQYEDQVGSFDIELYAHSATSRRYLRVKREGNLSDFDMNKPTTQMGVYRFEYNQLFHGIPLPQASAYSLAFSPKDAMDFPEGRMLGTIATKNDFTLLVYPVVEKEVLFDDASMIPFQTAKKEFEKLIKAGLIREVYDVRLAYYRYVDPESPGETFILQPTWQLRGVIADKATFPDPPPLEFNEEYTRNYSGQKAIVNALTGELIGQAPGWEYADPKQWK